MAQSRHNPNNDIELVNPPDDGVSSLSFAPNPQLNYLVGGSWDSTIRVWEVDGMSGQSMAKGVFNADAPVLSVAWHSDSSKVFGAGCDKLARAIDLNTGAMMPVAQHDGPIKSVKYTNECGLMTCGWDKAVKFWDLRSNGPTLALPVPERVYSADAIFPLAVAATADRFVQIFDLRNPSTEMRLDTTLKYQSRCVAVFPAVNGYAVGSIEGRIALRYLDVPPDDDKKNFSFKCHRVEGNQNREEIYSVNQIAFHPEYGTFASVGSDGAYFFWDKDSKQRLKPFQRSSLPISCCAFSGSGNIFAYAASYDWSKGYEGAQSKNYILLHGVKPDEIKPKPLVASQSNFNKPGSGKRN